MNHAESRLQAACVKWFRLQYPDTLIFAIPNGGARNAITGAILKAEGVMAGIPDLFIAKPCGMFHGLFIEMKADKGRVKPHQMEIIRKLQNTGYAVYVCRSFEAFQEAVQEYIHAPAHPVLG